MEVMMVLMTALYIVMRHARRAISVHLLSRACALNMGSLQSTWKQPELQQYGGRTDLLRGHSAELLRHSVADLCRSFLWKPYHQRVCLTDSAADLFLV